MTRVTAQLREPCTQTDAQVATAGRPAGHWTRVQDSPTVVSTVTRTRILPWWNIFYMPVDEHILRSYNLTSKFAFMAYWSNWQTPWITLYPLNMPVQFRYRLGTINTGNTGNSIAVIEWLLLIQKCFASTGMVPFCQYSFYSGSLPKVWYRLAVHNRYQNVTGKEL